MISLPIRPLSNLLNLLVHINAPRPPRGSLVQIQLPGHGDRHRREVRKSHGARVRSGALPSPSRPAPPRPSQQPRKTRHHIANPPRAAHHGRSATTDNKAVLRRSHGKIYGPVATTRQKPTEARGEGASSAAKPWAGVRSTAESTGAEPKHTENPKIAPKRFLVPVTLAQ